jgi:hypothetical protein
VTKTSLVHEAPLDVIREHPAVVLDVLSTVGHPLPADPALLDVVVAESTLTDAAPVHWAADLVVVIGEPASSRPKLVVVVEVQRDPDPDKRFAWPQYVAALAARHRAPVLLLVWVFDAGTAAWARGPHEIGLGLP